ncbi:MAG: prenyltransferase, partial [bacterium]
VLLYYRGFPMFLLGLIGLLGGYAYTGKPLGFKYIALGDLGVFLLMGPLMTLGAYFALTGEMSLDPVLISIPIGLLTVAILHANNTRDIIHDSQAQVKTVAVLLGLSASRYYYAALVLGALLFVLALVAWGLLSLWSLLTLFSLPLALKNIRQMLNAQMGKVEEIAMLDVHTAQHHLLFGLLLLLSLVLRHILPWEV